MRTPKTLLALPELRCTSHPRLAFADPRLPANLVSDGRRDLDLEHKLVQRFVHIGGADTDEAVERAIGTVPEELRITNEELLVGVTGKALEVVAFCTAKHVEPPPQGAQGAGGKTIVYSLYNQELYITITQLNVSGGPPLPQRAFCQRSTRVPKLTQPGAGRRLVRRGVAVLPRLAAPHGLHAAGRRHPGVHRGGVAELADPRAVGCAGGVRRRGVEPGEVGGG